MAIELKVPEVGESITEVMIGTWKKGVGEQVVADESVVEIESDKGHDAFLLDEPEMEQTIIGFLNAAAMARGLPLPEVSGAYND